MSTVKNSYRGWLFPLLFSVVVSSVFLIVFIRNYSVVTLRDRIEKHLDIEEARRLEELQREIVRLEKLKSGF